MSKALLTGYNSPVTNGNVNNIVLYAIEDSATTYSTLPSWYTNVNKMQDYLQYASYGNHNADVKILTDGNSPFRSSENFATDGIVYEMITKQFVKSVLEQADDQYDFTQFDNDGPDGIPNSGDDDGYVDYVSLNILSTIGDRGGTGLAGGQVFTWNSDDIGVSGDSIKVTSSDSAAIQQTIKYSSVSYSLPIHEYGHSVLGLPDMDHGGTFYFNHYALGAFDVMSTVFGFNGIPSIYNPKSRDEQLGWLNPVVLTASQSNYTVDNLLSSASNAIKINYSSKSGALNDQSFYLTWHDGTIFFESKWPITPISDINGKGGVLIWHKLNDHDLWSDYRRMPLDIEAAHGKYKWDIDVSSGTATNTGEADILGGRDSLEVRVVDNNGDIQGGPYYGKDNGSHSEFYIPGNNKEFSFYSNPSSNLYNSSSPYEQNIISGLDISNISYNSTSNNISLDVNMNDYTISNDATLTAGTWYFDKDVSVDNNATLIIGRVRPLNLIITSYWILARDQK